MEDLQELQKKADALIESVNPKDHVLGLEILRNSFELTDEHIIEHLIVKPFKEFIEMLREDAKLPLEQRKPLSCLLAIRPWESDLFKPLRKEKA